MTIDFNTADLYNDEAEKIILGILMVSQDKIKDILTSLTVSDFFDRRNQLIFKAIKELNDEDKVVDIVSVSEKLRFEKMLAQAGGREYITSLAMDIITTHNYKSYIKIIHKYSKKRNLLQVSNNIQQALKDNKDVDELVQLVKEDISKLFLNRNGSTLQNLFSGTINVMEKVNTILTSDSLTFGLPTGIKDLDLMINGLCPEKFYVLGARPAMGKSALAQQIAESIAKEHNVLYVSLEMGTDEFTERSILSACGLTKEMLSRKMIGLEEAMTKITEAASNIERLKLFIDDKPRCTLEQLEQSIIKCQSDNGSCDLIIIDYLQLMGIKDKRLFDTKDIVSQLSNGMKRISREYKVPVLALSQLSRQLETRLDKRPILSDLRESGAIEQDADVVLFLYRQEVYSKNPKDKGQAELIVAKNRDGRTGIIPMIFNSSRIKFTEVRK